MLCRLLGICFVLALTPWLVAAEKKTNIIFILADDVGYGDFGCYGGTSIPTPNIDRLAKEGIRFTDAHTPSAMCTPTRWGFMTGSYAWRSPTGHSPLLGDDPLSIPLDRLTLPQVMRDAGYATAAVGKWHLGLGSPTPNFNAELKPGPREVGFDYSFIMAGTGDRVPCVYIENQRVVGLDPQDPIQIVGGKSHHELMGSNRIGRQIGGTAALWKDEDMADVFTGKAIKFIEDNQAKPFFLYFAAHDCHNPTRPHPRFRNKSIAGARGDAVVSFDWSVGHILETLERLKLADNTLVIVTSDNGGFKVNGLRVPDRTNGSLRGHKMDLYEGGQRVPFVLRWPGKAPAGKTSDALISLTDMLATFAGIAEAKLPPEANIDSLNVKSAFQGGESPRTELVIHDGHGRMGVGLRRGPWVLLPAGIRSVESAKNDQLFNVVEDLAQTKNVASEYPEMVGELRKRLLEIFTLADN